MNTSDKIFEKLFQVAWYVWLSIALFVALGVPLIWNIFFPNIVPEGLLGPAFFLVAAITGWASVVMLFITINPKKVKKC